VFDFFYNQTIFTRVTLHKKILKKMSTTTTNDPVDYKKTQRKKSLWMSFISQTRQHPSLKELYGVHDRSCEPFYIPKKTLSNGQSNPKYNELKRLYANYKQKQTIGGLSKAYKKQVTSDEYKSSIEYKTDTSQRKKRKCDASVSSSSSASSTSSSSSTISKVKKTVKKPKKQPTKISSTEDNSSSNDSTDSKSTVSGGSSSDDLSSSSSSSEFQ
jgi:hypothetical protein